MLASPLTCNKGAKTWGCGTYPESLFCCISNTVSHYIEAKTRRRRYQKYPCYSFSYGSHSWDQCTVQPPTKKLVHWKYCARDIGPKVVLASPLTCNKGAKTWGCGTYPESLFCCISNTVSHYIEAKTRRRRYQKYPCCSFSYGSHSWDQCTVQPPTKKQTCTLEVLCARYWSKSRACFSLDLQQRGEDMGLWHLS